MTNAGARPIDRVLLMLSLADVTRTPAVPLGLEDWTTDPSAARATTLEPGQSLSRTWRLRMIQAGRIVVYASAVASGVSRVTNSRPVVLTIEPTRNLTPARVLPVVLGVPATMLGAVVLILGRRATRRDSKDGGIGGRGAARTIVMILMPAILWGAALSAGASATEGPDAAATERLEPILAITPEVTAAKTGDRLTVTASVRNTTGQPLSGATLLLGLVDITPGQTAPLGLETWTADPESVALPELAPDASASATWHLVMIQPGMLGLYVSVMPRAAGPIWSSALTPLSVGDRRVLNPRRVLPVALGEPTLLLVGIGLLRARRRGSDQAPARRQPDDEHNA
ncbi:MAG TPA: hypothetical protein VJX92_23295 [Methylomirabilota bacterium]|nr:hypothetical protein [Methylomirabilota bacterium]